MSVMMNYHKNLLQCFIVFIALLLDNNYRENEFSKLVRKSRNFSIKFYSHINSFGFKSN